MPRRILSALLLATLILASGCAKPAGRLLFVVPAELPSGGATTAQRADLEAYLASSQGGYTRIDGVEGGWLAPSGEVITEKNHLYLVSTKDRRALEGELQRRITTDFEQQAAWIERW